MTRSTTAGLVAIALFGAACTEAPVTLPLRSLERSGDVSFVCVGPNGEGYDINSCPDFDSTENRRHMLALVTQTLRGEVAVVDLSAGSVVDVDPSTPGFNFLPIGENPVDIVSTPGGVATFVGVASVGKEGIFALPSTCARAPARDITSWPACALPSAPGEMVIAIDPPGADDGDPTTPRPQRASCGGDYTVEAATVGTALGAVREVCPADLATEITPPGRRKLLVELPDQGGIAVIDAQGLLDRNPGEYKPCDIEQWLPLDVTLPPTPITQSVPSDLQAPGCVPPTIDYGPKPDAFLSRPSGLALSEDRLFVADRGAPVVHVLNVSDPCFPSAEPPLLPVAFEAPGRTVTTREVAVSPTTRNGERFAWAIDEFDGSVMIFDASPGAAERTPIVRPGAPLLPFEPADRLAYSSPVRDIAFALRDVPVADPETGVAPIGTLCDPDPDLDPADPAAKYRTSQDYSRGARPRRLRGVFGFAALASGQVVVVDIEDWDAPCRRPLTLNPAEMQDFRGCAGDPASPPFYTLEKTADGKRTVSGEASCRVVQKHRTRSGTFVATTGELGIRAPSLRSFPRLRAPEGGNLPTDQTDEGKQSPRLLAVEFESPAGGTSPAQVNVSTTLYSSASTESSDALVLDPGAADRLSLTLVQREPRAFADEDVSLEYEGALVSKRPAGFFQISPADPQPFSLVDADAGFCNRGVEDSTLAAEVGKSLGVPDGKISAFAQRHADYVQITSELRGQDDAFWSSGAGASCTGQSGKAAFFACRNQFGTTETPSALRDLRIIEAYQGRLVVEPRAAKSAADKQNIADAIACCFGGAALQYGVRAGHQWILRGAASGFRHDVIADQDLRCIRDCSPRRALLHSRAFEISSSACPVPSSGTIGTCAVGAATPDDVACVISGSGPVTPGGEGAACIFENLTHRFAVYRGNTPSERGMAFTWQVAGGFAPLTANLVAQSAAVLPQTMSFVPQIGQLAVVDGAAQGLVLVSLDSVGVSRLFF